MQNALEIVLWGCFYLPQSWFDTYSNLCVALKTRGSVKTVICSGDKLVQGTYRLNIVQMYTLSLTLDTNTDNWEIKDGVL